jgi:hypothetical protein
MVHKRMAAHFNCPNCNALYHVVRVEAEPETKDRQRTCRDCGCPFRGREGKNVLKYLLLRPPARPDPRARKGSQRYVRPN